MKKITQFETKQDYYLDENGSIYGRDGLMKSKTILTVNGHVTRTSDKWYCIVYLGAPSDGKFYTKRKNGKLEWTLKADKTYLNLNSYVPEIDDNRITYIYFLCDSRDGIPRYVGKTINLKGRFHGHLQDAKNCKNHKSNWIREVLKDGGKIEMVYLDQTKPDGSPGSGDWTKLETFWGGYLKYLGFPIIVDGGWGNGGKKRRATIQEKIKQREIHANLSGCDCYLYDIYEGQELTFSSISNAERFLKERKIINGKSQISGNQKFLGSDYLFSKQKLKSEKIKELVKNSKQIKLKVAQLDKNLNILKIYKSAREAVRNFGTTIFSVLDERKPHKSAYGYKWIYLIDFIDSDKTQLHERFKKSHQVTNFTEDEIKFIRENPNNLSVKKLCSMFKISHGTLHNIRYRRTIKYHE